MGHRRGLFALIAIAAVMCSPSSCVPADEALELGSVEFTILSSQRTQEGIIADETDGYAVTFDRVVLGFKTMTIGKIGVPDTCSYRGRGATSDIVFDPRRGTVQTFNGIQPIDCPDVGVIFGSPAYTTTLAGGATSADLIDLADGVPAHAIVEATFARPPFVRPPNPFGEPPPEPDPPFRVKLRFASELTSTRFGGCREAVRGIRILSNKREKVTVRFAAENLLRDAISTTTNMAVRPFLQADQQGNNDGIATMDELDELRLGSIFSGGTYQLPNGTKNGSFGDFVRSLFRFTLMFRNEEGICVGNEPGAFEDGQPNP